MSHALISKVRTLVSADRKRLKVDNLDLDLSYITPNLLAMSFPGSGIESAWRNSINDVCTLLNKKHNGKFMIWNLCERGYDYSKFNNQILDFPFPDHHAPSLNLLFEIVNSLDNWLKANPENIAVVHCKGGKGRTGTIICCYLYYSCYFETMDQSLRHFAEQRSHKKKGVTQPSQQRYINYFKEIVSGNFMIDVFSLNLVSIEMAPLTKEQAYSMSIEIFEHEKEANLSFASSPASLQVTAIDESQNQYKLNVVIGKKFIKDVLIRVYKGASGKKSSMKKQLFHLIFNISFIKLNENNRIVFGKKDLDHFKKDQKKFDENFYIECIFQNNCTVLPDHSLQIWNIMSVKYQQLRKMKEDEKLLSQTLSEQQQQSCNNTLNISRENEEDEVESLNSSSSLTSSTSSSINDNNNSSNNNNNNSSNLNDELTSPSISNSTSSMSISSSSISTTTSSLADLNISNNNINNNNNKDNNSNINTSGNSVGINPLKVSTSSMGDSAATTSTSNLTSPPTTTTTISNGSGNSSSSTSTPTFSTTPTIIMTNSSGVGTLSKGSSPVNYRESRMVSVDEMKQMILSFDLSNDNNSNNNNNNYHTIYTTTANITTTTTTTTSNSTTTTLSSNSASNTPTSSSSNLSSSSSSSTIIITSTSNTLTSKDNISSNGDSNNSSPLNSPATAPRQTAVHSMPNFSGFWTPKLPTSKRLSIQSHSASHRLGCSDGFINQVDSTKQTIIFSTTNIIIDDNKNNNINNNSSNSLSNSSPEPIQNS